MTGFAIIKEFRYEDTRTPQGPCLAGPIYHPEELISPVIPPDPAILEAMEGRWSHIFDSEGVNKIARDYYLSQQSAPRLHSDEKNFGLDQQNYKDLLKTLEDEQMSGILPNHYEDSQTFAMLQSMSREERHAFIRYGLSSFHYVVPQAFDRLTPSRKMMDRLMRHLFCTDEIRSGQNLGYCFTFNGMLEEDWKGKENGIAKPQSGGSCPSTPPDIERWNLMAMLSARPPEDLLVWMMGWQPLPEVVPEIQYSNAALKTDSAELDWNIAQVNGEDILKKWLNEMKPRSAEEEKILRIQFLTALAYHRFDIQLNLGPDETRGDEELDWEWETEEIENFVLSHFAPNESWMDDAELPMFCNVSPDLKICTPYFANYYKLFQGLPAFYQNMLSVMRYSGIFAQDPPFNIIQLDFEHAWKFQSASPHFPICRLSPIPWTTRYWTRCEDAPPLGWEWRAVHVPQELLEKPWDREAYISAFHELSHAWLSKNIGMDDRSFLWGAIDQLTQGERLCSFCFHATNKYRNFFDLFNESSYLSVVPAGSLMGHSESNADELLASAMTTFAYFPEVLARNIMENLPREEQPKAILIWAFLRDEVFGKVFIPDFEDPFADFQIR